MTDKEIEYQILRFLDENDHEEAIRRIKHAELCGYHHFGLYSYEKPISLYDIIAYSPDNEIHFLSISGPIKPATLGNIFISPDTIEEIKNWNKDV